MIFAFRVIIWLFLIEIYSYPPGGKAMKVYWQALHLLWMATLRDIKCRETLQVPETDYELFPMNIFSPSF